MGTKANSQKIMRRKYLISNILSALCGGGICCVILYWSVISPFHKKIEHLRDEADSKLLGSLGWDISIAVRLREGDQEKLLKSFDDIFLPNGIVILSEKFNESPTARFYLWRVKKYCRDFSVSFPEKQMNILKNVPDQRPSIYEKRDANPVR